MTDSDEIVESTNRRRVLKGIAGAGAGLAVTGGMTGTALAGKGDDCDPDGDIGRLDTSDHIDTTWYGSVYHEDEYDDDEYELVGADLPEEPDELLVHVHGWQNDRDCGIDAIETTAETYEDVEYEGTVTGLTWDSEYAWWNAKEIAEKNALKLAAFLREFAEDNPDTEIRLQGHSLGARVLAETVLELHESDDEDDELVTSVVFLAGAIDDDSVSLDGEYGEAIESVVDHAENFWMEDDSVLNWAYETYEWTSAIGNAGSDGEAPDNYTDHEITRDIGHSDHYQDEQVLEDVSETFETSE